MVVLLLLCASPILAATGPVRWCATWATKFSDSGFGEDYFNAAPETVQMSVARYSKAQLRVKGTTTLIFNGFLDSLGCTPYLNTTSGTVYEFRTFYTRYRDGMTIYVNPTAFAESTTVKSVEITPTSSAITDAYVLGSFGWWNENNNLAQLAGQVLWKESALSWPRPSVTYISTHANPGCNLSPSTYFDPSGDANRICVNPAYTTADGTEYNHTKYKFVVAHEMGHRQADGVGGVGFSGASYSNNDGNTDNPLWPVYNVEHYCNCYRNNPSSPPTTCIHSRTFIETAEQEGWANFFASAMFNYRSSTSGYWTISSKTYVPSGSSVSWDSTPPIAFNLLQRWKWMENHCGSTTSQTAEMANRGVITDWVQFFWQV